MKTTNNRLKRAIFFEYLPMAITGIGILTCAIVFKQAFIKVLPLFFSLIVMLFNSRAKRIGFLLGSINSVIYIIIYFIEGVYGTMFSAFFGIISMMTAFFCWKSDGKGNDTTFNKLTKKGLFSLGVISITAWVIVIIILTKVGGKAVVFDAFVLILGFTTPVLNIKAYIESPFINAVGCVCSCIMWVQIIVAENNLANLTFLISSLYSLYMVIRTLLKWVSSYKAQRAISCEKICSAT